MNNSVDHHKHNQHQVLLNNYQKISDILLYSYILDLFLMPLSSLSAASYAANMAGMLLVIGFVTANDNFKKWIFDQKNTEYKLLFFLFIIITALLLARFLDYDYQAHSLQSNIITAATYLIGALAVLIKFNNSILKNFQITYTELEKYYELSPLLLARLASLMAAGTQSMENYAIFLISALLLHFSSKNTQD